MSETFTPRRNLTPPLPVHTVVGGVEVSGEIIYLAPNDITVVITSPATGLGTWLHVPHFAMAPCNWLTASADSVILSSKGEQSAASLLKDLYDYAQGHPSGWGIWRTELDGRWTRLDADTSANE